MSTQSAIEWTDATWNPVRGCVKVSPGCAHCYAETFAERFRGVPGHPYEQGFDLRLVPEKLAEPLSWRKPRRVFVNSMSDLFQEGVPDSYIDQVFAVMALAPQHTFQVLTKRAERMREYMTDRRLFEVEHVIAQMKGLTATSALRERWPLPNVWLGVSVENRKFRDRILHLNETPAAVRFVSLEPLLEDPELNAAWIFYLDWLIVGGESGPAARPFNLEWARKIIALGKGTKTPVFVKQLGANPIGYVDDQTAWTIEAHGLQDRKGGDPSEWPDDLRVREFPT